MQEESACIAPGAPMKGEIGAHHQAQSLQKPVPLEHACHSAHPRTGLMRVNLAPPGKASVIALATTMMERRARDGLLRPTMMQEANWLAGWLR
ncbi:hypothetical protein ACFQU2_13810 [Siccirubricoccus deserti]